MIHYMVNKKHHSMLQCLGQKAKYVAEIEGAIKTGYNLAKGAYSVFQTVSPFLPLVGLL